MVFRDLVVDLFIDLFVDFRIYEIRFIVKVNAIAEIDSILITFTMIVDKFKFYTKMRKFNI